MVLRCIVPGCNSTSSIAAHQFPKISDKAHKWKQAVNNPKLEYLTLDDLCKKRVCHIHFNEDAYVPYAKKRRLNYDAVPTLYLPPKQDCVSPINDGIDITEVATSKSTLEIQLSPSIISSPQFSINMSSELHTPSHWSNKILIKSKTDSDVSTTVSIPRKAVSITMLNQSKNKSSFDTSHSTSVYDTPHRKRDGNVKVYGRNRKFTLDNEIDKVSFNEISPEDISKNLVRSPSNDINEQQRPQCDSTVQDNDFESSVAETTSVEGSTVQDQLKQCSLVDINEQQSKNLKVSHNLHNKYIQRNRSYNNANQKIKRQVPMLCIRHSHEFHGRCKRCDSHIFKKNSVEKPPKSSFRNCLKCHSINKELYSYRRCIRALRNRIVELEMLTQETYVEELSKLPDSYRHLFQMANRNFNKKPKV